MTLNNFKDALKYGIATAFVKPDKDNVNFSPLNILLISGAECGKTRLLEQILCQKTYKTFDISPKIISSVIVPLLVDKKINFLIIPDMIQMLGHKKTTTGSTIGFLNALIEEGVKDCDFFGMSFHLKEIVKAGLITAITTQEFYENVVKWHNIGFLHRILPISYDYTQDTTINIHKKLSNGNFLKEINEITLDKKIQDKIPFAISIPDFESDTIMELALRMTNKFKDFTIKTYKGSKDGKNKHEVKFDLKGFRIHDRLRQLARAICFIDSKGKRKAVNSSDIIKLRQISEVFNFPNTKISI